MKSLQKSGFDFYVNFPGGHSSVQFIHMRDHSNAKKSVFFVLFCFVVCVYLFVCVFVCFSFENGLDSRESQLGVKM